MFGVVLGCAWSFGLFYLEFGSKTKLGCFRLFQAVLGLLFLLYLVYCFLRSLLTFKMFQVVPGCSNVFLIVLTCFSVCFGCFRLFAFVLGRLSCFGCYGDSILFLLFEEDSNCFLLFFFVFSVVSNSIWLFENVFLLSEGCSWLLLKPFRLFIL